MKSKINIPVALVAPLDWGLGHATRSIPIIKSLQSAGYDVVIAAEGSAAFLLQKEFPHLRIIPLRGYSIRYTNQKRFFALKILWQMPKIVHTICYEHKWLKKTIDEYGISLVISDNRYGLWTSHAQCIFITHQLTIQAPFSWLRGLIQKINYSFINRYHQCWIPDFKAETNIAGILSHPKRMPATDVLYVGPLSRLSKKEFSPKYQWLFLLSGPEPQRSLLENKLIQLLPSIKGRVLFVRALPGSKTYLPDTENCTFKNHLTTEEMEDAFAGCEFVLSRCGYTTVMELLTLQKKSLLIPTPGQTEQEYLASHLMKQYWCLCCDQDNDLLTALDNAQAFEYRLPDINSQFELPENLRVNHL